MKARRDHRKGYDSGGPRGGVRTAAVAALIMVTLAAVATFAPAPALANSRYAAFVIDAASGEVFAQSNPDRPLYPASLTKMMTLYLTFEALDGGELTLGQRVGISRNAAGQAPSRLGLAPGSTIRVEDAIYSLVTKSANDIATALAETIGGDEVRFARQMTERAHELGMANTTFRNASGLPDRSQVSTARDMARLAQALIQDFPRYYHYFDVERWRYGSRTYRNHNRLLGQYEGMDGLKTGYIRASGFNLAASARRGQLRLIAVVFGGRSADRRNRAVAGLLDEAFESERGRHLIAHGAPFYPPLPGRRPGIAVASTFDTPLAPGRPGADAATAATTPRSVEASRTIMPPAARGYPLPPTPPDRRPDPATTAQVVESATVDKGVDGDLPPRNAWGIQVGAFYDASDSQRAIDRAKTTVPDILVEAERIVMPVDTNTGRMFRARLIGLDRQSAAVACERLVVAGTDCFTVSPANSF
ncbi:MAG: D-alanyl-D-alanine carboxypeptidase family protein [Alphaproteobacteria bacterium]